MSQTIRHFAAPKPGDIVWCRFPEAKTLHPAPKARPALVWRVGEIAGQTAVAIAYGTSQKVGRLFPGEFAIVPSDGAADTASGLRYPPKFNLARSVEVESPYNDRWFAVHRARHLASSQNWGFTSVTDAPGTSSFQGG